jgi:hypothetical protein
MGLPDDSAATTMTHTTCQPTSLTSSSMEIEITHKTRLHFEKGAGEREKQRQLSINTYK